jgi:hypothetical protein
MTLKNMEIRRKLGMFMGTIEHVENRIIGKLTGNAFALINRYSRHIRQEPLISPIRLLENAPFP